jgi:hypothetical protein
VVNYRIGRALLLPFAAIAVLGLSGCGGWAAGASFTPPSQSFYSRPDLHPPEVAVLTRARGTAIGYLFVAPKKGVDQAGPMILRDDGELVWFDPLDTNKVSNFRVQRYRGHPVLTWWIAESRRSGHRGQYVIADDSYRVIATVRPAGGVAGDLHEFVLTPRNTALLTVYHRLPYDLSDIGGPEHGAVWEGVVQEIDVESGRLLFEWHSLDHVGVDESYQSLPKGSKTFDYFHLNSIDIEANGNLLVSARFTQAVYEVRPSDGAVVWRLGGKRSDFAFGPGARFAWQHDARRQPDGTLSLFDNRAVDPEEGRESRVIVLRLDERRHRATLVRAYEHPKALLSTSQGNAQFLPGGHVLVGWGSKPYVTEFTRDGEVLLDMRLGSLRFDSYRAYRFGWVGRPLDRPAVAAVAEDGGTTVYVSWNGATEVAGWSVLAGPDEEHLAEVAQAPKGGFETAIDVPGRAEVFRVAALDANGHVLRTSPAVHSD